MNTDQQNVDSAIIDKIVKLLSLANSSNEHEAKSASEKAQELMLKYNIELQRVKGKHDYLDKPIAEEPYIRMHQPFIMNILKSHFFVDCYTSSFVYGYTVDGRRKNKHEINLIGTKTNIRLAHYVFDFLSRTFQELWLQHKRANGLGEKSRKAYYLGLRDGIKARLDEVRAKASTQKGLVWLGDPGLVAYVKTLPLTSGRGKKIWADQSAQDAGFEHGKKVEISKPITGTSSASGLQIGNRKH